MPGRRQMPRSPVRCAPVAPGSPRRGPWGREAYWGGEPRGDTVAGSCAGVGMVVPPWGMLCCAADTHRQRAPVVSPRRASVGAGHGSAVGWVRIWLHRAGVWVRLRGHTGLGALVAPVGLGRCRGGGRGAPGVSAGTGAECWGVLIRQGVVSLRGTPGLGALGAAGPRAGGKAGLSPVLCGGGGCHQRVPGDRSLGWPCVDVSLQHPGHVPRVSLRGCVPGVSLCGCVPAAPRTCSHCVPMWLCPQGVLAVPRTGPWGVPAAPKTHPWGVPAWLCPQGVPVAPRTCPRGVPVAPRTRPWGVPAWLCPWGVSAAPRTRPRGVPAAPRTRRWGVPAWVCPRGVSPGCPRSTQDVLGHVPGAVQWLRWLSEGPQGRGCPGGPRWSQQLGGHGGVPTERPPVGVGQTHATP